MSYSFCEISVDNIALYIFFLVRLVPFWVPPASTTLPSCPFAWWQAVEWRLINTPFLFFFFSPCVSHCWNHHFSSFSDTPPSFYFPREKCRGYQRLFLLNRWVLLFWFLSEKRKKMVEKISKVPTALGRTSFFFLFSTGSSPHSFNSDIIQKSKTIPPPLFYTLTNTPADLPYYYHYYWFVSLPKKNFFDIFFFTLQLFLLCLSLLRSGLSIVYSFMFNSTYKYSKRLITFIFDKEGEAWE